MNSKDFIQALRKVIREEVQSAVRTEFKKLNEGMIYETRKPQPVTTSYTQTYKPKATTKKQYSNNPLLNDLLNDTAFVPSEGPAVMLEEQINYNDYAEWPTMTSRMPVQRQAPTVLTDVNGARVNVQQLAQTEAGAAVVNALTKDYSALMKAIDKKKGK
jgi:hypothetical protein